MAKVNKRAYQQPKQQSTTVEAGPISKDQHCATCIYYTDMHCHRFPPSILKPSLDMDAQSYQAMRPRVARDEWCGEWVDKRK